MNKKRATALAVIGLLALTGLEPSAASAAPKWVQIRTTNFLLAGDADEHQIRNVAQRLEEFHEALSRLMPAAHFDRTPTIVLVFANDRSYQPFKPLYQGKPIDVAGYFQTGPDVNYVTMLTSDGEDPYPIVYHEFAHLVVHALFNDVPVWFDEGMSEFYSSFAVMGDGKRANIGKVIARHVLLLRDRWVPLQQVLATGHDAALYNNSPNRDVFYAESWAFVHYLRNGSDARRPQLFPFVAKLAAGTGLEQASMEAFGKPIAGMEKEVRQYVQRMGFVSEVFTFDDSIASRTRAAAQPLTEAAVEARLGDLLAHMNRNDEAEKRLQNALKLDPGQVLAHLSLGAMRLRQQKDAEGLKYLERATSLEADNFDAALAYGDAVLRHRSASPTPATIETARKAYARALDIRPDSPDAMIGLAWALFMADERLDEAQRLAERAAAADPKEPDPVLLLAQLHANQRDFAGARALLGPLMASSKPGVRERARAVMTSILQYEQATTAPPGTERVVVTRNPGARGRGATESPVIDTPPSGTTSYTLYLRAVKEGEQRAFGSLERIECAPAAVVFHVKSGDRTLRVSAAKFDGIEFITYRDDLKGNVGCGPRTPADPVYVTFRLPAATAAGATDGEVVAIEFVPKDYVEKK